MKWMLMIIALLVVPTVASAEDEKPQSEPSLQERSPSHAWRSPVYDPPVVHRRVGPRLTIGGRSILGINLWETTAAPGSFFGGYSPNVRILGVPVARLDGFFWSGGYRPPLRTYNQYYQGSRYRGSYGGGYGGGYRGSYGGGGGYQDRDWSHLKR